MQIDSAFVESKSNFFGDCPLFTMKKPDASGVPLHGLELEKPMTSSTVKNFTAHADAGASNCSIINEWLTMRGDLESEGDILIKGKVHGNIKCKLLIVDSEAAIEGGIDCEELVIRGATRGIIRANRVRLEKTANVDGEIYQQSFSAEEGAKIRGALRHSDELKGSVSEIKPAKSNGSHAAA